MKKHTHTQLVRIAALTTVILSFAFFANAQNQTPAQQTTILNSALPKSGTGAADGGAVRLVDNKGTIKYLQVQNGLTQITNVATDGTGVTTTWQLGGTLTDATTLTASDGKDLQLNGLKLVDYGSAATAAGTVGDRTNGTTGWTVLVRDETTGAIEKVLLSSLLQVTGGHDVEKVVASSGTINAGSAPQTFTPTAGSLPTGTGAVNKISVYRNGAKLIAGTDYTLSTTTTGAITLTPGTSTTDNSEWNLYVGDVIEVQWVN